VREVEKTMVLEVAFDSIHESKRHKSGLAMRFPRISRIRTDKPAAEADLIDTLRRMIA
jgi:DNA ligase-1